MAAVVRFEMSFVIFNEDIVSKGSVSPMDKHVELRGGKRERGAGLVACVQVLGPFLPPLFFLILWAAAAAAAAGYSKLIFVSLKEERKKLTGAYSVTCQFSQVPEY
ncbi:hypothetical protein OUZ56_017650 [Daphnia magna]|uniref:Uncharacterized protein n=1 Tax=Daphnia magna TaxID=35525 RepID=A0ABR0ATA6_9CRUS|nr:hypothetical protein OUZ56_017650 [Daphnia magna]